jgi:hypothetical protein
MEIKATFENKKIWLVYRGRIQTVDNLKRKRWKGMRNVSFV